MILQTNILSIKVIATPLTTSDLIQLVGILASLITSIIAIIISIVTTHQNSKMIEESSRAVIGIYGESINTGVPMFYMVVKNFGNSTATITKFESDFDFADCYTASSPTRNYIEDLSHCTIAPGQSRICRLDYSKIKAPITFELEYYSSGKKYSEKNTIDLTAACSMLQQKIATEGKEWHTISYTLQEMLQKNL